MKKCSVLHEGKECFCIRFIPKEQQGSGPHLCRDCDHPESCHPELTSSGSATARTVDDVMKNFRPELAKLRKVATDSEARRETSSGFRKADYVENELEVKKKKPNAGRGGRTKFKVDDNV